MRFWVDAWDPAYSTAGDGGGPAQSSTAELDPDVEVPAPGWRPMHPPADLRAPDHVLLVDGVRRQDAMVWTAEPDGGSYPGLAASYAAGVVHCDLARGAAVLADAEVERGLFTASPTAVDITAGQVRYRVHRVRADDPAQLTAAVPGTLTTLETSLAARARAAVEDPAALLVLDGPLRGRTELRQTVGYVKTHQRRYLPPELNQVVTALAAGQRSPVFRLGTSWRCYSWYVRLPGAGGAPWAGLARLECSIELPVNAAVGLADLSAVTLPRFAAAGHKDPRAPQNLIPIAGLEQRLRARLGDRTLLHRALLRTAALAA